MLILHLYNYRWRHYTVNFQYILLNLNLVQGIWERERKRKREYRILLKILRLIQKDFIIGARQKRTSVFIWHVAKKKNDSSKADRPLLLHNKLVKNFRAALRFYVFSTARDRNRYSYLFLYIFLFRGSDLIGFLNIETVDIRRKREMANKILILKIWKISMCCRNGEKTRIQGLLDAASLRRKYLYVWHNKHNNFNNERSIQITLRMTNIFQTVLTVI